MKTHSVKMGAKGTSMVRGWKWKRERGRILRKEVNAHLILWACRECRGNLLCQRRKRPTAWEDARALGLDHHSSQFDAL